MTTLAVIDSDTPAFASAISCEDYYFEDAHGDMWRRKKDAPPEVRDELRQFWETTAPPEFAVARTEKFIGGILEDAGCDDYVLMIGGGENFRYELEQPKGFAYKGNREDMHTPMYLDDTRDYLINNHPCVVCDGMEADDGCGILMYEGMEGYDKLLLCHIDKDMNMIAGDHMKWARTINGTVHPAEFYTVSEVEALRCFYLQLLTGDSTDNIPGLFKMTGKKVTKKVKEGLNKFSRDVQMYNYVRAVYLDSGFEGDVDHFLTVIGRMLWIQREDKQLWNPPTERVMR